MKHFTQPESDRRGGSGRMELLAPAGSYEAAKAAVNAGADAIYMGGPLFSARAYAESSADGGRDAKAEGEDMLLRSIRYCHLRGVKVYMTLNILMKEKEMDGLAEYLRPYADAKLDGVIVQDLGVMRLIRESFPNLPLHVSTQAVVTGPRYAKALKKLGAVRVVPARELSLSELKAIHEEADIEVEAFSHGALCYSYSGRCLMSSVIGGRSGNRGRCAGPCRLNYGVYDAKGRKIPSGDGYVLSLKDLCTLSLLGKMKEAGVCSLKIEGRMKSPLYVASVTAIYRKYLDLLECTPEKLPVRNGLIEVEEADIRFIVETFDRGGITDGYLTRHNGREMVVLKEKPSLRVPDSSMLEEIRSRYVEKDSKIPVRIFVQVHVGECPEYTLMTEDGSYSFTARAEQTAEEAANRAVTKEEILEKAIKLGGTDLEAVSAEVDLSAQCFVQMKILNELRRKAADGLQQYILESYRIG